LSPGDARRQALVGFGNVTRTQEQCREIRLLAGLESILLDVRYAVHGMLRNPSFAIVAILSLGLAIGANTAIYSIVDAAMLRPLPVANPENLFTLSTNDVEQLANGAANARESFSYPLYKQFGEVADQSARLAIFSAANRVEAQIPEQDDTFEKATQQFVSGNAFEVLQVSPAIGRLFSTEEDRGPGSHPGRSPELRVLAAAF